LSATSSPAAASVESVPPVRPPSREATGPVSSERDVSATAAIPAALRDPLAAPSAAARSSAAGLARGTASRPSATRDTETSVAWVVNPYTRGGATSAGQSELRRGSTIRSTARGPPHAAAAASPSSGPLTAAGGRTPAARSTPARAPTATPAAVPVSRPAAEGRPGPAAALISRGASPACRPRTVRSTWLVDASAVVPAAPAAAPRSSPESSDLVCDLIGSASCVLLPGQ
jgi:hypothetical protein